MTTVQHYSSTGRFNLCSNEKQFQVVLRTPYGTVSELWNEDPGYDDEMEPDEVLDLIEARAKSYWISTSRGETLAKITTIREHLAEVTASWAAAQAKKFQAAAARAADKARRYHNLVLSEGC